MLDVFPQTAPKSEPVKTTPLIRAPYPPSIITLQNLLHKQKLKLVDLFKKADRSRTMKFKRVDFLRIIQEVGGKTLHSLVVDFGGFESLLSPG